MLKMIEMFNPTEYKIKSVATGNVCDSISRAKKNQVSSVPTMLKNDLK